MFTYEICTDYCGVAVYLCGEHIMNCPDESCHLLAKGVMPTYFLSRFTDYQVIIKVRRLSPRLRHPQGNHHHVIRRVRRTEREGLVTTTGVATDKFDEAVIYLDMSIAINNPWHIERACADVAMWAGYAYLVGELGSVEGTMGPKQARLAEAVWVERGTILTMAALTRPTGPQLMDVLRLRADLWAAQTVLNSMSLQAVINEFDSIGLRVRGKELLSLKLSVAGMKEGIGQPWYCTC